MHVPRIPELSFSNDFLRFFFFNSKRFALNGTKQQIQTEQGKVATFTIHNNTEASLSTSVFISVTGIQKLPCWLGKAKKNYLLIYIISTGNNLRNKATKSLDK